MKGIDPVAVPGYSIDQWVTDTSDGSVHRIDNITTQVIDGNEVNSLYLKDVKDRLIKLLMKI